MGRELVSREGALKGTKRSPVMLQTHLDLGLLDGKGDGDGKLCQENGDHDTVKHDSPVVAAAVKLLLVHVVLGGADREETKRCISSQSEKKQRAAEKGRSTKSDKEGSNYLQRLYRRTM